MNNPETKRPIAFRMAPDRLDDLSALSRIADTSMAEQIDKACETYVDYRTTDPEFPVMVNAARLIWAEKDAALYPEKKDEIKRIKGAIPIPSTGSLIVTSVLPVKIRDKLQAITLVDATLEPDRITSLADEVREAVHTHLAAAKSNPAFQSAFQQPNQEWS